MFSIRLLYADTKHQYETCTIEYGRLLFRKIQQTAAVAQHKHEAGEKEEKH
jgi:hypothetical protein